MSPHRRVNYLEKMSPLCCRAFLKESDVVRVQACAMITIGVCGNIRFALTDVKHRVVFSVSRWTENLHPIFRLARDEKLLDISYFRVGV